MRERDTGRRTWLVAGGVAVVIVTGLLALFRSPAVRETALPPVGPPTVTLARDQDVLLTEEAAMRDPTPLFLPTAFNAAEEVFAAGARRERSSSFRGYEPKLKYPETAVELRWPPVVELPQRTVDAFEVAEPIRPFMGFGRTEVELAPLAPRKAFVDVVSAGNGELMFARPLSGANPPAEATWQPLLFLVAVDGSGVVGPPVLTESSGVTAVDSYFQDYLVNVLHVGERLGPGYYRVGIGP